MEQHVRDLSSAELWHTSLERSRKRRELAHDGRRRMARKKQASSAVTAAMLLTPVLQVAGASAGKKTGKNEVTSASPANRAVENRTLDVTLVEGATGARVAQLQQLLGVNVDGIFGPQTAEAVRAFQARAGLPVDGVVGGATWNALFGSSGTRGAADSVVEGKGYQVTVQRASKEEAQILGDVPKRGAVAKITLTRGQTAAMTKPAVATDDGSRPAKPRKRDRDRDRDTSSGGDSRGEAAEERDEPRGGATGDRAPETEPAVETRDTPAPAVRGACGSGRLVNPVKGTRTSNYGPRGGRNHDGIDIAAPTGTPVRAAACGVITEMGVQSGYGNIVCVDHGGGFTTCYAHLSGFKGREGQRVHAGDVIGYVGSTGRSTGPHLHFETRVNGQARNPDPYLRGQRHPGTRHAKTQTADSSSRTSTARGGRDWDDTTRPARASKSSSSTGGAEYETSGWQYDSKDQATTTQGRQQAPAAQQQPRSTPAQQQAAPAAQPAPAAPVQQQAAPAPVQQAAPAPVQQAAPAAPVEEAAPAPVEQAAPEAPAAEAPAPVEQAAPEAPAAETPAPAEQAAPEAPAAETPAPAEQAPAAETPAPAEQATPGPEAPAAEAPAPAEPATPAAEAPAPEAPAADAAPAAPAAEQAAPATAGATG